MPKLPQVSGKKVIKLLENLGYLAFRQKGSHVTLRKTTPIGVHNITILEHDVISKGTLNDILNKVSLWNNLSKEELIKRLK